MNHESYKASKLSHKKKKIILLRIVQERDVSPFSGDVRTSFILSPQSSEIYHINLSLAHVAVEKPSLQWGVSALSRATSK